MYDSCDDLSYSSSSVTDAYDHSYASFDEISVSHGESQVVWLMIIAMQIQVVMSLVLNPRGRRAVINVLVAATVWLMCKATQVVRMNQRMVSYMFFL